MVGQFARFSSSWSKGLSVSVKHVDIVAPQYRTYQTKNKQSSINERLFTWAINACWQNVVMPTTRGRDSSQHMMKAMVGSLHTLKQVNRTGINEVLK